MFLDWVIGTAGNTIKSAGFWQQASLIERNLRCAEIGGLLIETGI